MLTRLLLLQATVIYIWFLFPSQAKANSDFWFSNRVEFGYDKVSIRESVTVKSGEFIRNRVSIGFKFDLSKTLGCRTFYLLENSLKNDWQNSHQIGAQLSFKFK